MTRRKDPAVRARNNPENRPFRVVELKTCPQPPLPKGFPYDGKTFKWPQITVDWWDHWADSPLIDGFTVHDWDYLLDTAVLHAKHWLGLDAKAAGEMRQRLSRFGVTPEDRAKLRIILVDADNKEEESKVAAERNSKVSITGNARRLTDASFSFEDDKTG